MKRFTFSLWARCACLCLAVLMFAQCKDDDEDGPDPAEQREAADHTLLVYIAGDNSLSSYSDQNIRSMEQGLLSADSALHLIIFEDNRSLSSSLLFRVERHGERLDTVTLATFNEDLNSADSEVLKEVLRLAFADCESSIKGFEFWSHAMSWIPSSNFSASVLRQASASRSVAPTVDSDAANDFDGDNEEAQRLQPAYIGVDGSDYMELWDLREALETGPHLDYIMMDACYCSMAEVAYELRNVTDYMLAAPTEIFNVGFPYNKMIPQLTQMNADNREEVLVAAAKEFQNLYATNGTFAVIRTAGMESLVEQWRDSHALYPEVWQAIADSSVTWVGRLQRYGRQIIGSYYYFFDYADLLQQVAAFGGNPDGGPDVSAAVVYEYHSNIFTDSSEQLVIRSSCGLGVSVPELFPLCGISKNRNMQAAYPLTQWGQAVSGE